MRFFSIVFFLSLAGPALADDGGGRPREPFSDGERAFREVKELLRKRYVDPLSEDDLYRAAVEGMLAAGNRKYDKLLTPTERADLEAESSGEVVGVGVEIDYDAASGTATIVAPLPGSPAERAGIAPGDRVLKVDGRSMQGRPLRDIVSAMRGKAGTEVTLTLLRDDRVLALTVRRAVMAWSPVETMALPDGVALVTIRAFNARTPSLLRAALAKIAGEGARGLVLDLRGNEGGLFEEMVQCASLLLPAGSPVVTKIERGGAEEPLRARGGPAIAGVPIAVLATDSTASGAEMLAGALRQAGARVVGKRTHGKWNAQWVTDLANHYAVKWTVALFASAGGERLDGRGLDPDLEVDMDPKAIEHAQRIADPVARLAADNQLRAAVGLLRLAPRPR